MLSRLNSFWRSLVLGLMAGSVAGLATGSVAVAEQEWPQFRGPQGNGYAEAARLPIHWSETENITWKIPVEGEGFSSPVISGNQLWLTTAHVEVLPPEQEEALLAQLANPRGIKFGGALTLRALAFDIRTGQLLHNIECFQFSAANPKHATNSYASPTPILEGQKVYCHFGDYGTCCLDTQSGAILWKNQELHIDHQNGPGSSPVLWRDLLIVHFDGTDQQFLAAFQKETGKLAWKTMRSGEMHPKAEFQKAYCTPVIHTVDGKEQLISPAANWVYGYDPATGKELWKANYGQLGFSTVPKPVVGQGMIFVCTSFIKSRLVAVREGGAGDVTESHVVWHSDRQIPQKPSLMLVGQELYFTADNGVGTCLNALTGETNWVERFRGQYSASPLFANGHLYFFNQEGITTVLKPGSQFDVVAENQLESGCMASPAVSGNSLFLRTMKHLYRIDAPKIQQTSLSTPN